MEHGKVIIGCDLDTRSFDAQINYVESQMQEIEDKLKQADMGFEVGDTQKLEANYEKLGIKLDNLRKKQAKLNQEQAQMGKLDLSGVQAGINNVNKGIQGTIKKVAKWSLALFGIRTAYNAIRGAMSTLSQYDTQMADNIEYIRYALASALQPVIQTILNLVIKLLQYINYIAKAWTGKNLFKTADAFKSAQKSASGVAKSAKEINKQLAGFDEMNVLSDSSSAGGGGADISAPNIDLTGMQGEIPEWIKWIADNKDLILSVFAGVTAGLLAWKLGLTGIQALGIGIAIAGIVFAIQSILAYLQDPSWKNFGKIITGIGIAVAGVAIIFGAWPVAIAGAIIAVIGIIVSNWEKIKAFLQGGIDWLKGKGREIIDKVFGGFLTPIYDAFVNNLQLILDYFDRTFKNIKTIFDNIIGFVKNVFAGNWKSAWENIKNIFKAIFNQMLNFFNLIFGKIKNSVVAVGKTVGNILAGVFKAVVNGVMGAIENILNSPIRTINSLIKTINKVPGINLGTLSTFKLPRLAKGGIINQPGRGVPIGYGQAIGGENRAEGVIPLTDSQQMQLLGEAIGRYVTINANITNTMNGRVISRELQKVNNTNDFAFNR